MRILVLRFSSAGDIILTSLFLRSLRERFPEATIDMMVLAEFAPLVEHSLRIDRLLTAERGWSFRQLAAFKSGVLQNNPSGYDYVFDLHNSLRSRYVRLGLGKTYGIIRKHSLLRWLLVRRKINRLRPIVPVAERYLQAGSGVGLTNDGQGLELFIGHTLAPIIRLEQRITIALAPGARHATKRWPVERFIELGQELARSRNARIVLLGGAMDVDSCREIAGAIGSDVVNLAGRTTLLETAAAIDACNVVVANDSAITHIAAARGIPVVTIFGATVVEFGFAPYGVPSLVVENKNLSCRPCSTVGSQRCPMGHFQCMLGIEVAEVLSAVNRLMP